MRDSLKRLFAHWKMFGDGKEYMKSCHEGEWQEAKHGGDDEDMAHAENGKDSDPPGLGAGDKVRLVG